MGGYLGGARDRRARDRLHRDLLRVRGLAGNRRRDRARHHRDGRVDHSGLAHRHRSTGAGRGSQRAAIESIDAPLRTAEFTRRLANVPDGSLPDALVRGLAEILGRTWRS